jgi:hypothetical protein
MTIHCSGSPGKQGNRERGEYMRIAQPKRPYDRSPEYGYAPRSLDHVKVGGWVEVVIGDEYVNVDGEQVNCIYATVVAITPAGRIYAVVADEVQDPHITGIQNGDVLELELADITKSEHSPAQQDWELYCQLQEVQRSIVKAHKAEFEERYPEFSDDAFGAAWAASAVDVDYGSRWLEAQRQFVEMLTSEGRA